jgi:hypothetical protein
MPKKSSPRSKTPKQLEQDLQTQTGDKGLRINKPTGLGKGDHKNYAVTDKHGAEIDIRHPDITDKSKPNRGATVGGADAGGGRLSPSAGDQVRSISRAMNQVGDKIKEVQKEKPKKDSLKKRELENRMARGVRKQGEKVLNREKGKALGYVKEERLSLNERFNRICGKGPDKWLSRDL